MADDINRGNDGPAQDKGKAAAAATAGDAGGSQPSKPTLIIKPAGQPRKLGSMKPSSAPKPSATSSSASSIPHPPFIKHDPVASTTPTPSTSSIMPPPPGKGGTDLLPIFKRNPSGPASSASASASAPASAKKFMPSLAKARQAEQLRLEKEAKAKSKYDNDVIVTADEVAAKEREKEERRKKRKDRQSTTASGPWAQGPATKESSSKKSSVYSSGATTSESGVRVKRESGLESAGLGLSSSKRGGTGSNVIVSSTSAAGMDEYDEEDEKARLNDAFRGLDLEDDVAPDILDPYVIRARREHVAESLKRAKMDVDTENGQDGIWPGNDNGIECEALKHHGKFGFWALPSKLPVPLRDGGSAGLSDGVSVKKENDGVVVKKEKDVRVKVEPGLYGDSSIVNNKKVLPSKKRDNPAPKGGQIGDVVVRRSGKMELRLGDYVFDLTDAPPTEFLQKVALFEMGEMGDNAEGFLLGDVGSRYVVSPNIEHLLRQVHS